MPHFSVFFASVRLIVQIGITAHTFGQSLFKVIHGVALKNDRSSCVKDQKRELEIPTLPTFSPPNWGSISV